jgi:hypothetical protein
MRMKPFLKCVYGKQYGPHAANQTCDWDLRCHWMVLDCFRIEQNSVWVRALSGPMHLGLGAPYSVPDYRSPVPLAKFQMAPKSSILISSGSKKKEPRYACLSEARASHSHKMWNEVSSSVPHFLQVRSLHSPMICKCLLKVLCPVSRPITTPDCVLLKASSQAPIARSGPKLDCLSYGPNLVPSDFHLFVPFKKPFSGKTFAADANMK